MNILKRLFLQKTVGPISKEMQNKSLMCKPIMMTKATSCNPIRVGKNTQTGVQRKTFFFKLNSISMGGFIVRLYTVYYERLTTLKR